MIRAGCSHRFGPKVMAHSEQLVSGWSVVGALFLSLSATHSTLGLMSYVVCGVLDDTRKKLHHQHAPRAHAHTDGWSTKPRAASPRPGDNTDPLSYNRELWVA